MAGRIAKPRITANLVRGQLTAIDDEERLLEQEFLDADLTGAAAEHVELSGCRLTRCRLGSSELDKSIFVDVALEQCDLANARWPDSAWTRVAVSSSRLTGFAGPGATFQHVTFRDSVLDLASYRFAKFTRTEFTDCRLRTADFVSADLTGATFRDCDLTSAEFSQVKAQGARFINCTWDNTRGLASLAGATIANSSPIDTLTVTTALAGSLGITITHPDELD